MTSPEFDALVDRASASLSSEELNQARSVEDVEALLDRRFFKGGAGDQRTRYQDIPIKTLIATDIYKNVEAVAAAPVEEEHGYERAGGVIGAIRQTFRPLRTFVRNLPIFSGLRSALHKGILGRRKQREAAQRKVLVKRSSRFKLRFITKPLRPKVSFRRKLGKLVLRGSKRVAPKKKVVMKTDLGITTLGTKKLKKLRKTT